MPIDNDVYNREGEGWWEICVLSTSGVGAAGEPPTATKPCMISVGAEISARSKPHGRRHFAPVAGFQSVAGMETRPTRYQCHRCARI